MAASRPVRPADRWCGGALRADLVAAARLAVICTVAALCARLLFAPGRDGLLLFAPQLGVALGLLARRGRATPFDAVGVLLAELFAAAATGSPVTTLPFALLHAALPFVCLPAMRRLGIALPACASVREYLTFLGTAGLAPAGAAALLALALGTAVPGAVLYGVGVGMGTILPAPPLAVRGGTPLDALRAPMSVAEGLLLTAGFVLATALLLRQEQIPLALVWGVALVWTAIRHGFFATSLLALLLWSLSFALGLRGGAGPLATGAEGPLRAAAELERDVGLAVVMSCILAVALEQERRLTAWAVARARELETLIRALPDLVFRLDREGRILDYRAGVAEDGSVPPEAFLGRRITDLLPTPVASVFAQAIDRALSSPELVQFEYGLPAPDDGRRHFEARLSALESGRLLLVVRDVTERARAEAELRARARALARSNAELQQFAYIASHDLQEPLRTVAGFCELLERRYGDRLDETGREFIAFAVDGARRMQSLVRDLLDLSRVATRGRPFEPVDCRALVERVAADLQGALADTGGEIRIGPLPTVRADGSQLAQLFANLVGNALKYRGERPPRVRVWAERRGEGHLFHVEDNGIGIPPEFHEQVFEAFRRLHTRDEYPGNGIGLAICRKIVARHGGWIRVRSQPGEGSDFHFWMPEDPGDPDTGAFVPGPAENAVSAAGDGEARGRRARDGHPVEGGSGPAR